MLHYVDFTSTYDLQYGPESLQYYISLHSKFYPTPYLSCNITYIYGLIFNEQKKYVSDINFNLDLKNRTCTFEDCHNEPDKENETELQWHRFCFLSLAQRSVILQEQLYNSYQLPLTWITLCAKPTKGMTVFNVRLIEQTENCLKWLGIKFFQNFCMIQQKLPYCRS